MRIKWYIAKGLKYLLNPPALKDCSIDALANVGTRCELTRVRVGRHSFVGHQCFMVNTEIGQFCSIGERCCVGGAIHPVQYVTTSPAFIKNLNGTKYKYIELEREPTPRTVIENDVWMGTGVYVKAGVTIRSGAVVGMNSVVTHDVGPYEIWAGNPAKKINDRFDQEIKEGLLKSRWWDFEDEKLRELAHLFNDPKALLIELEKGREMKV